MHSGLPSSSRAVRPVEATQTSERHATAKWPGETTSEHIRNSLALLAIDRDGGGSAWEEIEARLNAALSTNAATIKEANEALQILRAGATAADDLARIESHLTCAVEGQRKIPVWKSDKLTNRLTTVSA